MNSSATGGRPSAHSDGKEGTGDVRTASTCENPYRDTTRFYSHSGCIHSWFEDPPEIHVNDLTNEVQWNPGGGCATAGFSTVSNYQKWLTATGWTRASDRWLPEFSCNGVVSHNETAFQNTAFCLGFLPVLTGYNQKITGNPNGTYSWNVDWAKNGVCSDLLSFHTEQN